MSNKNLAKRRDLIFALIIFVILAALYFSRAAEASALPIDAIEIVAVKYNTPAYLPTSSPTLIPSPTPILIAPGQDDAQPATQLDLVTVDQIPTSLDEAWYWIENGEHGFVFDIPCPPLSGVPFVTWDMAEQLAQNEGLGRQHPFIQVDASTITNVAAQGNMTFNGSGVITMSEDEVYTELLGLLDNGSIQICGEGKPTLYGNGLQDFLNWLAQ